MHLRFSWRIYDYGSNYLFSSSLFLSLDIPDVYPINFKHDLNTTIFLNILVSILI